MTDRLRTLTLATKLERMRDYFRREGESCLTWEALAILAGQKGDTPVDPEELEAAADGTISVLPRAVADSLCRSCGIDPEYLTPTYDGEDYQIDQRLRLWIVIRKRQGRSFVARFLGGDLTEEEFEELIKLMERLPVPGRAHSDTRVHHEAALRAVP